MDQFALQFLLLDESSIFLTMLVMIVLGGVVGFFTTQPKQCYSRIQYIWAFCGLNLAISIAQVGWLLVPQAAEAGLLAILVAAMVLSFAAFGLGNYYIAAARSNDIVGNPSKAWMGFVPFVNLYLIFAKGQRTPETADQSLARRIILNPILVVGALFLLVIANAVTEVIDQYQFPDPSSNAALASAISSSTTLEESLKLEAEASSALLPKRLDQITVLQAIRADGRYLVMTYQLDQEIPKLNDNFKKTLAVEQCKQEMFAYDLARGAVLVFKYFGPGGDLVENFEISQKDC